MLGLCGVVGRLWVVGLYGILVLLCYGAIGAIADVAANTKMYNAYAHVNI